ncbi:MAG: SAM-dependent methyltransferase [Prevotellaceae bacterium]|nr:SAM-dependent methyltransferase [Prevotellaceae bacterium]
MADNKIDCERWTREMRDFVQEHLEDSAAELLLSAHRYRGIDVPFAVEQIEARRRLKAKLPEWYGNADLVMGGRVPAEQCSSEIVAKYKRGIIEGESLCDMTGGMGVDFWYMSEGMKRAVYTERQEFLCGAARHNFSVLADGKHPEVEVRHGDGCVLPIPQVDVIYLDPARRGEDGSRVYAIEECEPDVTVWQDELLRHARTVLVKLSPMVDVTDVLRKMKNVTEVHVLAVRNECKEILVKQQSGVRSGEGGTPAYALGCRVFCVDFFQSYTMKYSFAFSADGAGACAVTDRGVMKYIYEPDVTLMKARAWGSLCGSFPVCQLDYDTRLMTSDELIEDFPGRIFAVKEQMPFSSKVAKRLKRSIPQANISTRNFILTADELRRRTGIKDGGEVYLFGAKVNNFDYVLLKCRKILLTLHHNETF